MRYRPSSSIILTTSRTLTQLDSTAQGLGRTHGMSGLPPPNGSRVSGERMWAQHAARVRCTRMLGGHQAEVSETHASRLNPPARRAFPAEKDPTGPKPWPLSSVV